MSQFKLYEINDLLRQAVAAADVATDQDTGEIPEDWAKFLEDVEMERTEKALAVAAMVRELKAESDAIKVEADRLKARERAAKNRSESLKAYLQSMMQEGEKLKDSRVSISWSHRESVDVADAAAVPDTLCKIERTPMLTAIKAAIEQGVDVVGCKIVDRKFITIR